MAILIVYFRLKGLVSSFAFPHYVNVLLFHWVYFRSFVDHFIKQNICFQKQPLGNLVQKAVLHEC